MSTISNYIFIKINDKVRFYHPLSFNDPILEQVQRKIRFSLTNNLHKKLIS